MGVLWYPNTRADTLGSIMAGTFLPKTHLKEDLRSSAGASALTPPREYSCGIPQCMNWMFTPL